MDVQEQKERGLKLRVDMFGREAVDKRMNAFGDFGKPLQQIINAYAYGDVWQRPSLPPAVKSLGWRSVHGQSATAPFAWSIFWSVPRYAVGS